jgi:hypothetical protein
MLHPFLYACLEYSPVATGSLFSSLYLHRCSCVPYLVSVSKPLYPFSLCILASKSSPHSCVQGTASLSSPVCKELCPARSLSIRNCILASSLYVRHCTLAPYLFVRNCFLAPSLHVRKLYLCKELCPFPISVCKQLYSRFISVWKYRILATSLFVSICIPVPV